jgi:hypothetical protein
VGDLPSTMKWRRPTRIHTRERDWVDEPNMSVKARGRLLTHPSSSQPNPTNTSHLGSSSALALVDIRFAR